MTKNHYVKNTDLVEQIEISLKEGQMTEKLGLMIILIVNRFARKPCYNGYTYLDEMKHDAICSLMDNWDKFDLNFSRKFPYYKKEEGNIVNITKEEYDKLNDRREINRRYPNPLSYYTTAIKNSFTRTLNKEKRYREINEEIMTSSMTDEQYKNHHNVRGQ